MNLYSREVVSLGGAQEAKVGQGSQGSGWSWSTTRSVDVETHDFTHVRGGAE